jgi:hypothetical protein
MKFRDLMLYTALVPPVLLALCGVYLIVRGIVGHPLF